MTLLDWVKLILTVIAGITACIPAVVSLVKFVKKAVREKNWGPVMRLVLDLMVEAETQFDSGAERKEWVLSMLKKAEPVLNFDIDYDAISAMIDAICGASKVVNGPLEGGA